MKVKAKSPGYTTGLTEGELEVLIENTSKLACECSQAEDERLKSLNKISKYKPNEGELVLKSTNKDSPPEK